MLALMWMLVSNAIAGCGALKPDSFGNRSWDNEAFRITVESGTPSLSVMIRKAGIEGTAILEGTVTFALEDATIIERPVAKPAPPAAGLWGTSTSVPVTTWWVPVALDDELKAALIRSRIKAIKFTDSLRTLTMEYPAMAVEVIVEGNAGKVPAARARPISEMVACL